MDEKRRWIKLYMMDYDEVYHDSKMLHLWIDILLHANPVDYYHHGELIKRGQCILSLRQVSERCGMAKNTITKYLHLLEECGKIKLDISRKGTLITVENWDIYQNRVSPSVLKIGQEVGQEVGRNKNKRIKEIKNKRRLTRQEEIFNSLTSKNLDKYYSDVYEKCDAYGFDRINNLGAFAIAVAEELAAKEKLTLSTRKNEIKEEVSDEEVAELRKMMEGLGGDL